MKDLRKQIEKKKRDLHLIREDLERKLLAVNNHINALEHVEKEENFLWMPQAPQPDKEEAKDDSGIRDTTP